MKYCICEENSKISNMSTFHLLEHNCRCLLFLKFSFAFFPTVQNLFLSLNWLFLFYFWRLGTTPNCCSGPNPDSALRDHSWWNSGAIMWHQESFSCTISLAPCQSFDTTLDKMTYKFWKWNKWFFSCLISQKHLQCLTTSSVLKLPSTARSFYLLYVFSGFLQTVLPLPILIFNKGAIPLLVPLKQSRGAAVVMRISFCLFT